VSRPFFWLIEKDTQSKDFQISYRGDGVIEMGANLDERELGQAEAYLSMVPLMYTLVPLVLTVGIAPDTFLWAFVSVVLVIPMILAAGALGEITIEQVNHE